MTQMNGNNAEWLAIVSGDEAYVCDAHRNTEDVRVIRRLTTHERQPVADCVVCVSGDA